jgi:hypothetical protein
MTVDTVDTVARSGDLSIQPPDERTMPFKGLRPFTEDDADYFFSRDTERDIILGNLMSTRLLLLYGPSGVGKSSILYAGVVHALHEIARSNRQASGIPELAVVVVDAWRDDPVVTLKQRLAAALRKAVTDPRIGLPSPNLPLQAYLAAAAECVQGELFIILDQFEEYLLYQGGDTGGSHFGGELPRVLHDTSLPVSILLALREDSLARLDVFKASIPNLFANRVRLDYLDREGARAAIEQPIQRYNRLYPERAVQIEPALVDAVLGGVEIGHVDFTEAGRGGQGGSAGQIATPYLQLVMRRLWDEEARRGSRRLRLATLQDLDRGLGGVKKIVRAHLDEKLSILSAAEQEVAAEILRYLVTRSGTKYAYSIRDLADEEQTGLPALRISGVVRKLARGDVRILTNVGPPPGAGSEGEDRYQIFHDVLAPAILDWRRRHAERKRNRRLRLVTGAVGLVGTGALGWLATVAVTKQTEAQRAEQRADSVVGFFRQLDAPDPTIAAVSGPHPVDSVATPADTLPPSPVDTASAPRVTPLVYIQFRGGVSRAVVEELRAELNQAGYPAPGTERIQYSFSSHVSYFHAQDQALADTLVQRTRSFFHARECRLDRPLQLLHLPQAASRVRRGQVEIWIHGNCSG